MRLKTVFFLTLSSLTVFVTPAFAACSGPAGIAGQILYNTDYSVVQYCNGTSWMALGGSTADTRIGSLIANAFCTGNAGGTGIACTTTTIPSANLGSGTANTTTFLRGDGTWATPAGSVSGTGAAGYLAYWNGATGLSYDNTLGGQLFWDSASHNLGVGNATPAEKVDVVGNVKTDGVILRAVTGAAAPGGAGSVSTTGTSGYLAKYSSASALVNSVVYETGGNVGIGTTSPSTALQVNGTVTAASISTSSFVPPTVQVFTSGSGTYTTPTSPRSPVYLKVRIVGGGGGGSGSGGSINLGGTGGTTTFGSFMTANGGGTLSLDNPVGGTASITTSSTVKQVLAVQGGSGQARVLSSTGSVTSLGGQGGASYFGGGGAGTGTPVGGGFAANVYGGGGGGCGIANSGSTGNGGGAGGYAEAIVYTPAASYTYSIGTGGTAGTAGTNGCNGGAGASGVVIVEEYYQ